MVVTISQTLLNMFALIETLSIVSIVAGSLLALTKEKRKYKIIGGILVGIGALGTFKIESMQFSRISKASVEAQLAN